MDFQTLVPSWYIDGSNFCFEARHKSNQDFGAPAAPPTLMLMESTPPGGGLNQHVGNQGPFVSELLLYLILPPHTFYIRINNEKPQPPSI